MASRRPISRRRKSKAAAGVSDRRIAHQCGALFSRAYVEKVACQRGVHKTRHIHGAYTMTSDDIVQARKFSDGIARSCYFIDSHNPIGSQDVHQKAGTRGAPRADFARRRATTTRFHSAACSRASVPICWSPAARSRRHTKQRRPFGSWRRCVGSARPPELRPRRRSAATWTRSRFRANGFGPRFLISRTG